MDRFYCGEDSGYLYFFWTFRGKTSRKNDKAGQYISRAGILIRRCGPVKTFPFPVVFINVNISISTYLSTLDLTVDENKMAAWKF